MGHRKELKNITGGIISSFTSRNNDVDGYWELGKLYAFCKTNNHEAIKLNILDVEIEPKADEFIPLVRMWKSKLESHLESRNIPILWIRTATILSKFNQDYFEEYHYWGSKLGDHCTCVCEITTDDGKVYSTTAGTNCKPHNSEKESRSTRRSDF